MVLELKSIGRLFIDEVMRPLYIFIVLNCAIWLYEEYYYYCIMIFVSAVAGIAASLYETYRLNKKIF